MNDYDPFRKNIYDKVFTILKNGQSFCVMHENGSVHDFPYAYLSYSFLSPDDSAIKIKHNSCEILICGTKLTKLFKAIRRREVDTIKIGGEAEIEKSGLISVRSVYYENISDGAPGNPVTENQNNEMFSGKRDSSRNIGVDL
jgi:hypothetical protein